MPQTSQARISPWAPWGDAQENPSCPQVGVDQESPQDPGTPPPSVPFLYGDQSNQKTLGLPWAQGYETSTVGGREVEG